MQHAFKAMQRARQWHKGQSRKYTGNPYADHLAEVAGIVATVTRSDDCIAIAWLHDCMEDQGVTLETLEFEFSKKIAHGVLLLSDLETGNRATRKALSRDRLAAAPADIQTIKVADLISNTGSIVRHDTNFAQTYLREKLHLLEVLTKADIRLRELAFNQARAALLSL